MPTEEAVKYNLERVIVPGVMRGPMQMNLVRHVSVADGKVVITLVSTALPERVQKEIEDRIKLATGKLAGVNEVHVSFVDGKLKDLNDIGHVIAIMSGKGGVGKSLVASLAAVALRRQGYEVGILDADITGASIPRMFGINTRPMGSDSGILPVLSRAGIEVMSINLFLPNEDDAVIWRGLLIDRAIMQFWEEVLWGKLDYLIVDLPPGTADAPLTVMQSLPISGIIIVFTPQQLTAMVVRKAVNMARQMGKPILGVVENMSYLCVPQIDKKIELFGRSRANEMARAADAPLLAQLPVDPELAKLCDEGDIERYNSEIMSRLGESLSQITSVEATSGRNKHKT